MALCLRSKFDDAGRGIPPGAARPESRPQSFLKFSSWDRVVEWGVTSSESLARLPNHVNARNASITEIWGLVEFPGASGNALLNSSLSVGGYFAVNVQAIRGISTKG